MRKLRAKDKPSWMTRWVELRTWEGLILLGGLLLSGGCGTGEFYSTSPEGKKMFNTYQIQAIKDRATLALSSSDCQTALAYTSALYDSDDSDNDVRMLVSAAYGCYSGVNIFSALGKMMENASALSGAGFWGLLTGMYPSVKTDRIVEAAMFGMDAAMAALKTGQVLVPFDLINTTTKNPGSINILDRIDNANVFIFFLSMAVIGGTQNRWGAPNSAYLKTQNLPWTTAATMDGEGCAYASSILNFVDTIGGFANAVGGPVKDSLLQVQSLFQQGIYLACDLGCQNLPIGGGWVPSGCTVTTACASCPRGLRDRQRCTGQTDDQVSCAAAGIVNFINVSPAGWQTGI